MVTDKDILAILGHRENYDRYFPHVKDNFLTREGEAIGFKLDEFFKQDVLKNTEEIDWPKFSAWFFLKHPTMQLDQKENFKKVLTSLDGYEPDNDYAAAVLEELTVKSYATDIAAKAQGIADGVITEPLSIVRELADECQDLVDGMGDGDDPHLASSDWEYLFGKDEDHPSLEFSMESLRKACGPITLGDLIVVGANPDSGKTTYLLGECAHMLPQLPDDKVILYFSNEQSAKNMQHRKLSSVLHKRPAEIFADSVKYLQDFKDAGGDRIMLYDQSFMDMKFVEDRLRRHEGEIGLIVIDQLWKIRGISKSSNDFMQLGHQFSWARGICKEYAPTIAVHQADGSAYNMDYLGMEHLFGSRVAVQGEADAIIMIGQKTDGSTLPDLRFFNVAKNKLPGQPGADRNPRFQAFIDHDRACFKEVTGS